MIAYVIEAAKQSGIFNRIVVTTDSERIKTISQLYGADMVIDRPPELATDDAVVEDAIIHALGKLPKYDYILLLEPTSPLLIGRDILKAAKIILNKNADMVLSVCKASPDMVMIGRLGKDNSMYNFLPKDMRTCPRQKRPDYYYLNSAIYLGKYYIWAEKIDYYEKDTVAMIMHPEDSIHIDTEEDLIKVERLMERRKIFREFLNG